MAGITDWSILSTQSTAGYVGAGAVAGGGQFNFDLTDGQDNNYSASYRGFGGGMGAGLELPSGAIISGIMDFYMPAIRGLLNSVASQDIYCSNLFATGSGELSWTHLNDTLYIVAIGAECGASIGANLLIWVDYYDTYTVSSRTGARYATRRNSVQALAVTCGWGIGVYGVAGTFTVCGCNRFATT